MTYLMLSVLLDLRIKNNNEYRRWQEMLVM